MTRFRCDKCTREFATKQSRAQHMRDKHGRQNQKPPRITKEGAMAVMAEMDDLPDGAFFAMAADLGLEPEDFLTGDE